MNSIKVWLKRFLCWVFVFSIVFSIPFSFAEVSDGSTEPPEEILAEIPLEPTAVPTEEPAAIPTAEPTPVPTEETTPVPTEEPTTAPTEEPTAAPTEEPTAVPTEEPTAVSVQDLETPAPTEEPTATPATDEPTVEAALAPETPEPTEAPTPEPSEEPEPVPYTGYAKLTERSRVYKTDNTSTVEYRLPADTIVYVDGIVLENVERVYVNYSVDSKKTGGYVELSVVSSMPQHEQDAFKLELEKNGNPVYHDTQNQILLPAVIPEYPASATSGASAASTTIMTEKADTSLSQAQKNAIVLNGMKSQNKATYNCTSVSQLQSPHPYGNNRQDVYIYQQTGAAKITLTFSNDTFLETNFDLIGIFDAKDQLVDNVAYTGSGLAGRTITVPGDTVQIFLMTDSSVTKYGFRVASLSAYTAPPTAPTATAINATSVHLSWSASSKISGYYIYRASSANGTYTYLGQTTNTSYVASAPSGAVSYYKICGYGLISGTKYLSGYSPYIDIYPLATPTINSITKVSSIQLNVQWNAIANASKYELYHSTSQNGTYTKIQELTGTSAALSLNNQQLHYFKVRAVKTVGATIYYGSFSAIKIGVFNINKVTLTELYVMSTSQIRLSWSAVTGATGYQVYRRTSSTGAYKKIADTNQLTYIDSTCNSGQYYYYKVRAYAGTSSPTYGEFSTLRAGYTLSHPKSPTISRSGNTVTLKWNKVANASRYCIYTSTSATGTYTKLATTAGLSYTTTYRAGLHYRVRAYRSTSAGNNYFGPYSASRTIAISNIGTVKLTELYVMSPSQVRLSWSAVAGATGYQIYRRTSSKGSYVKIAETAKLTYTDSACAGGQYYYYKVRAYVGASSPAYGEFSTLKACYTMSHPKSPTTSRSGDNITLKWNKVTNASRYYIYISTTATGTYTHLATTTELSYITTYTPGLYYRVRACRATSAGNNYLGPYSAAKTIGSKYRALLISNSYSGDLALSGTANDSAGMQSMLGRMTATPYAVTRKTNLTATQMLSQISSVFSGATGDDVSLFFFSGHGASNGSIVGNDSYGISPSQLRTRLDTIPGTKIVLVDSCHSGAMIGKSADEVAAAKAANDSFVNAFISEFAKADRNLAASNYYVITAAHSTQYSAESTINGTRAGFFTYALCQGAGWDYSRGSSTSFPADTNRDRNLSLHEVYTYTYTNARQLNSGQSAQVYPTNSSFTLFGY